MPSESIVDAQGRRLGNLRVSLTSACNYACIYCVADGKRLQARDDSLPLDKLLLAVEYLKTVNPLERLRITGGEPLISPLFDGFMKAVRRLLRRCIADQQRAIAVAQAPTITGGRRQAYQHFTRHLGC